MTDHLLLFPAVFVLLLSSTHTQTSVYHCDFDTGLVGDCVFSLTTGSNSFATTNGAQTTADIPTQPLSDVLSIRECSESHLSLRFSSPNAVSPTSPDGKHCELPYKSLSSGRDVYFCERFSPMNFTCSTAPGTGNCNAGEFVLLMSSDRVSSCRHVWTGHGQHEPVRSDCRPR